MRIAVGLLVVLTFAEYVPVLARGQSDAGWLPAEAARELMDSLHWSILHYVTSPTIVVALGIVGLVAAITMTLGIRSRTSAWICLVLLASIHVRNPALLYGADSLTRLLLFYTALGRCGAVWSVDAIRDRIRSERERDDPLRPRRFAAPVAIPIFPLRLLQFQFVVLYAFAGIAKLFGTTWAEGSATWYALVNPVYARFDAVPSAIVPLVALGTHVVVWWELLWPVLVVAHPWSRRVALAMGVGVHGGILVGMRIKWWCYGMLIGYLGFVAPRTYRWIELRVCRRQRRELEARALAFEFDAANTQHRRAASTVRALDSFGLVRLRPTPDASPRFVAKNGEAADIVAGLRLLPAMAPLHLAARLPLIGASARRYAERLLTPR